MLKMLALRVARLIATLLAVSIITFAMTLLLPGDPINAILPPTAERDPQVMAEIREEYGLDDPLVVRYKDWLSDAVIHRDLGTSYVTRGQTVSGQIKNRVPVTGQLAVMAIIIALVLAIPIGVLGAYRQGKWDDQLSSAGMQVALSIPNFIAAIMLGWLFAIKLDLLPNTGWSRIGKDGVWANLQRSILPATALALTQMAIFSRLIRSDMIATLQENYILSARAKGLPDRFVLFRHALRPSSLSLVTIVGINFGALLGGTVVIEQVFSLPGLGSKLLEAISSRDILMVQGITVFIATVYVVVNTLVDLLYIVIDPRIRRS